jgi:predicted PurR-regulated permease PerM
VLPGWLRTTLAFVIISLICVGIFQIITLNLELIIKKLPEYVENFKHMVSNLNSLDAFQEIGDKALAGIGSINIQGMLTGLLNSLTNIAGNIFAIIIYVAFMIVEEKFFNKKLYILVKDKERQERISRIINQITQSVRKYISVKTQMSLLTGLLSFIILVMFQVDFPVLWAFLIFLLNYIPYIGSFVATLLPAVFAMFQYQSAWILLWIFLAIQGVQLIVGNVLEPKVMGRSLNLSPLGVMLALTFWGVIWGVLGMILSVPITSVMVITLSRFESTKFIAVWLSETGEIHAETE